MTARALTPVRVAVLVGLVLTVCRIGSCRVFELADWRALDYRLRERGPEPVGDRVIIVAVDDASIAQRGRWPWSRSLMARLLTRIAADEPAVIGADFVQSERSTTCSVDAIGDHIDPQCRTAVDRALAEASSEDQQFADAVRAAGHAVLGYFFDFDRPAPDPAAVASAKLTAYKMVRVSEEGSALDIPRAPAITGNLPEITAAASGLGYFNFKPDRDGIYRRVPMAIAFGDRIAMPLSLAMLQVMWADRPASIRFSGSSVVAVEVGGRPVPVASDGQLLLNYRGPGGTFPRISAADLLAGTVPAGTFRDKIVLVGITAIGVGDVRATPFDPDFPGVEIHANALDNILRRDALLQPGWGMPWTGAAELGALWTAVLLTGLVLRYTRGVQAALGTVVLLAAYRTASQWVFTRSGLVLSTAYPVFGVTLTYLVSSLHHYLVSEAEKRRTRRMLDLYLSPKVAAYISERPEVLKLGEKRERTVLFCDIRDFTPISESMDPEALVELLNAYLGEMTSAVFAHEGMLDKYIGDAIMAVWGAPLPQEDHAQRACRAALEMIDRLGRFNRDSEGRGWPPLRIGVGLSTGPMVFGNMGSSRHQSLTVMGDYVNLGARLEGLSRVYRCPIIASEATVVAAGEGFISRELDHVQVKGKTRVVRIFEILGLAAEHQADGFVSAFAEGLAAYRKRQWDGAIERFRHVLEVRPSDGPTRLFLERCEVYLKQPPPPDWQAVTSFG